MTPGGDYAPPTACSRSDLDATLPGSVTVPSRASNRDPTRVQIDVAVQDIFDLSLDVQPRRGRLDHDGIEVPGHCRQVANAARRGVLPILPVDGPAQFDVTASNDHLELVVGNFEIPVHRIDGCRSEIVVAVAGSNLPTIAARTNVASDLLWVGSVRLDQPFVQNRNFPHMTETVREEINHLAATIRALELKLEEALAKRRIELNFKVHDGVVHFEQAVIARHRLLRARLLKYVFGARPAMILSAPAIYSLIIPFILLDLFVAVYQAACFPVYGIPRVRRSDYFAFDREGLAYLNVIEKINCAYCAYSNGLLSYVREIASRTEEYWCPIKHARRVLGAHPRYASFVDYGDGDAYRHDLERLRAAARSEETT